MAYLGPAPSPWHSELRQAAPRALSRVALLVGGRAGHSPRLAEPQPRRIEATRGQGRCPKVSRGRRAAAGRPPSLRTRPCLARRATAGSPPAATWSARVPHQQVLQQPTSRVGSRHAARAAATRRDRHQRQPATLLRYPALVGCRVTQHLAARAPAGLWIDRRRRDRDSRLTRRAGGLKATHDSSEAHARAPRCTARSTRAGRCAGCWRLQRTHPDAGMLADGLRKLGSGRAPRRGAATATPSVTHVSRPQPLRPL